MRQFVAILALFVTLATGGATVVSGRSLNYSTQPGIVLLVAKLAAKQQAETLELALPKPARTSLTVRLSPVVRAVDPQLDFSLFERPPPFFA